MSQTEQLIEQCSIGKVNGTECHKKNYTQVVNLKNIEAISASEKELLAARSGVSCALILTVCEHHKIYYLKKFETYQTSCFDPFNCHKKKITKSLRTVTSDFSEKNQ